MDITKLLSEDVSHSFPLTVEDAYGAVLPMSNYRTEQRDYPLNVPPVLEQV